MSNKVVVKKESISTPDADRIDKKTKEHPATDKVARQTKKPQKNSSVSQIDDVEESAVGAVKANSSRTVRGSSGLANTGTIISYN